MKNLIALQFACASTSRSQSSVTQTIDMMDPIMNGSCTKSLHDNGFQLVASNKHKWKK